MGHLESYLSPSCDPPPASFPSSCHTPASISALGAIFDRGPQASDHASLLPLLAGREEWPQDHV